MKILLLAILLFWNTLSMCAQNIGINSTGATPAPSAMLDVASGSKGLLIPRISLVSNTDVATIPSPAVSLLVYNSNAAMTNGNGLGFYYWNGTVWLPIGMTSVSGGPCRVSTITNELDGAGAVTVGVGLGAAMTIITCGSYCLSLSYNGYTDWHLPSYDDLVNLQPTAVSNTSANLVWSSSDGSIGNAYSGLVFSTGAAYRPISTSTYYCRCVR